MIDPAYIDTLTDALDPQRPNNVKPQTVTVRAALRAMRAEWKADVADAVRQAREAPMPTVPLMANGWPTWLSVRARNIITKNSLTVEQVRKGGIEYIREQRFRDCGQRTEIELLAAASYMVPVEDDAPRCESCGDTRDVMLTGDDVDLCRSCARELGKELAPPTAPVPEAISPWLNHEGQLCGLCDGTHKHEHAQVRCPACGECGLAENWPFRKCGACTPKPRVSLERAIDIAQGKTGEFSRGLSPTPRAQAEARLLAALGVFHASPEYDRVSCEGLREAAEALLAAPPEPQAPPPDRAAWRERARNLVAASDEQSIRDLDEILDAPLRWPVAGDEGLLREAAIMLRGVAAWMDDPKERKEWKHEIAAFLARPEVDRLLLARAPAAPPKEDAK